jgi:hypothetical protein
MPAEQWARLSEDIDCGLRRGAWYRAVAVTPKEVLILVHGKERPFSRDTLEVIDNPPFRWTVVSGASNSGLIPVRWGKGYVVCPGCRMRQLPLGRPQVLRCERCNGAFEIAWDEPYLTRRTC